ncbi:MAG: Holliday junction branch migration protein RuvA [Actinomycetota bacterium]
MIDVNGVGYLVQVTPALALSVRPGSAISVHTAFVVRDDAFTIFGFETADELRTFDLLRSVSGVGPKSALSIIHQLAPEQLADAIVSGDDTAFKKVSGIGPKTAKLLVVSLAGKFTDGAKLGSASSADADVIAALVGLGYQTKPATDAVLQARKSLPDGAQDELLRESLRLLSAK